MAPIEELPQGWWSFITRLTGAGAGPSGTYVLDPPRPEVTRRLDDRLEWLRGEARVPASLAVTREPAHPEPMRPLATDGLVALAAGAGCEIPEALTVLAGDRSLWERLRSCTLCYFDLGERLVAVEGGGHLIHLLSDQQWAMHWLTYCGPGPHGCVLASTEPLGFSDDDGGHSTLKASSTTAAICAGSLTEFLYRFWIENELFFANDERRPFTLEQSRYLEAVRATRT